MYIKDGQSEVLVPFKLDFIQASLQHAASLMVMISCIKIVLLLQFNCTVFISFLINF